ncbi:cytochrome P450 [Trametes polyzona]|nr:cytochrome P450 [Trametes polyzona]
MIDQAVLPTFWTGVAAFVLLYLLKWRLDPLYHIPTVGGTSLPLLSYIGAHKFVRNGRKVVEEGYQKYYGRPFKVPMWDRWVVFVSGGDMIEDIRRRPDDEMSFQESVEDTMQLGHILEPSIMGNPYHIDLIRERLTRTLPVVMPDVVDEVMSAVPQQIPATTDDWVEVNLMGVVLQMVARLSGRVFVGLPLCRNQEYLDLAIRFTIDVVRDRDMLNKWPQVLKPYISRCYSLARRCLKRNEELLRGEIAERRAMMDKRGDNWVDKPNDLLQWFLDAETTNGRFDTIADRVMAINFAAIHTSSFSASFTLLRLAQHPQYIEPLREEIQAVIEEEGWSKAAMGKLWKLDSLLKEFQRHQGLGLGSLSRKMMKDVTLIDGTVVPCGTMLLATSYDIHHDGSIYENPEVFDPFRFSRMREQSEEQASKHQFVNTSVNYIPFGHGKHACPGRFFASNELKALLAYIILNYDLKLGEAGYSDSTVFDGLSVVPAVDAQVMFRKRETKV